MKKIIFLLAFATVVAWSCSDEDPMQLSYHDIYGYDYINNKTEKVNGSFFIAKGKNLTYTETDKTEESAIYDIKTTGADPNFTTARVLGIVDQDACVLSFKYKSDKVIKPIISLDIARAAASATLADIEIASDWKEYSWDFGSDKGLISTSKWGEMGSYFRMTLKQASYDTGANLQIKDMKFRKRTADEQSFADKGQWVVLTTQDGGGSRDFQNITIAEGGYNLIKRDVIKFTIFPNNNWTQCELFARPFRVGEQNRLKFEYKCTTKTTLLAFFNVPNYDGPHAVAVMEPTSEWKQIDADLSGSLSGKDQSIFGTAKLQFAFYGDDPNWHDLYLRGMNFCGE